MTGTTLEFRRIDADQLPMAIAVAGRAFWNDPLFNHFARDLLRQHRNLPGILGADIRDCYDNGEVWVALSGSDVAGVAAWLPPGVFPAKSGARLLKQLRRSLMPALRGRNLRIGVRLLNKVATVHPTEDHWYLAVLATDPMYQGRGVGRGLLEPMLERADQAGLLTYLETQKESNLPYYGRFGFEVADVVEVDGSPPIWTMKRQPR